MAKFHLKFGKLLQGKFELRKVNVAFVFQVNCPGCFIYGIPIMNEVYRSLRDEAGFIGVATAFEDFQFNNEENLKLLLKNGKLVGETKKYYQANYGVAEYPETLEFPTAFDQMTTSDQFVDSELIEEMCNIVPDFPSFPDTEKEILRGRVKQYYLPLPFIAETFTVNQLKGTPSFIIFDDNFNVLANLFGHEEAAVLKSIIHNYL